MKVLTVGDIKKALVRFDDDIPVVSATDEEGNGYHLHYYHPSLLKLEDIKGLLYPEEQNLLTSKKIQHVVCIN